jgi:hypothetical protein
MILTLVLIHFQSLNPVKLSLIHLLHPLYPIFLSLKSLNFFLNNSLLFYHLVKESFDYLIILDLVFNHPGVIALLITTVIAYFLILIMIHYMFNRFTLLFYQFLTLISKQVDLCQSSFSKLYFLDYFWY